MSLIVLKRKSQTTYNKLSSRGNVGFSLNNPRRVDSHRNKVQTQTPMKGNVPRGHGTCCGKYPIVINKSQYNNYDFHERQYNGIKSNQGISVKNHHGSMAVRHKWMKGTYPNWVVKDMNVKHGDSYITEKRNKTICQNYANDQNALTSNLCENNCNKKKVSSIPIVKDVNTLSQSEYVKTKLLDKQCLPTPENKKHYPIPLSGNCVSGNSKI